MRKTLTSGLAAGLVLALSAPAPARAQDEQPVYREIGPKQMEKILREMGFEFEKLPDIQKGDRGLHQWRLKMGVCRPLLYSDGTDMQLYAGFSDANVSPRKMNEWNRTKRFHRAYIAKDNKGVCLESDLDFTGGVPISQVKEHIKLFRLALGEFLKFIDEEK